MGNQCSGLEWTKDELDLLGISVQYLAEHFMLEVHRAGLDRNARIYEIENVIRKKGANRMCPINHKRGAAYVHTLEGNDQVGLATIMLSYVWDYSIGDAVDMLLRYCSSKELNPKRTYVWIYSFCVDQHSLQHSCFEIFRQQYAKRITSIGNILVMIAPWKTPLNLTQAWCMYEVFAANQCGCKVTMMMPPREEEDFVSLFEGDDTEENDRLAHVRICFSTLSNISVAKAKASAPADLSNILKLIEDGPGYSEFDATVKSLIRTWVIQLILDQVEFTCQSLTNIDCDDDTANFLNRIGNLFQQIGEYEASYSIYYQVLALWENQFGAEHVNTVALKNNIVIAYNGHGDYDRVLADNEKNYGTEHIRTVRTLLNMGNALKRKKRFDDALEKLDRALSIIEKRFGGHVFKAVALSSIANVLHDQGEYEKALEMNHRAFSTFEKMLGSEEYNAEVVAMNLCNLGNLFFDQGKFKEALDQYNRALQIGENLPDGDDKLSPSIHLQKNIALILSSEGID